MAQTMTQTMNRHVSKWLNGLTFGIAGIAATSMLSVDAEAQARLAMGGTHSGSAFYSYQVAVVSDWNDNVDDVWMSIQELGGASASTEALLRGEVDMGISVTSSDHAAKEGEGNYNSPAEDLRTLFFFAPLPLNWTVSAESDIESLDDLAGVEFSAGGRGTATEGQTETVLEILGIEPNFSRGGASDALDAYQNRRIDAFVKAGLHPDGYIQQAHSSRPIRLLSMDEEQAAKVAEARPYFSVGRVDPKDYYGDQPSPLVTIQTAIGINTTTNLAEEAAYGIVERVFSDAGIEAAAEGYAPAAQVDPLQLTLDASVAPLHAGVVRYMKEHGHEVPEALIPPEYSE
jgi:hypothetical protein